MNKAFDRVSWPYLISILRAFEFCEQWIDQVQRLVSNNYFSILINGESRGFFKSSRGVHQGDPLSPGLFIIAAELFFRSLNLMLDDPNFTHYAIPRNCPVISHLSYADDIIIFSSGLKKSLNAIKKVIKIYENCSGKRVNNQKSCFMVGKNITNSRKVVIKNTSGFNQKRSPMTYLGCPIFTGRKVKCLFTGLIDSIRGRMSNWSKNFLSSGGRLTLI